MDPLQESVEFFKFCRILKPTWLPGQSHQNIVQKIPRARSSQNPPSWPILAPLGSYGLQNGPKMAPRCPKLAHVPSTWPQHGPTWPQHGLNMAQHGSTWPKLTSTWLNLAQFGLNMAQLGPPKPAKTLKILSFLDKVFGGSATMIHRSQLDP